ncbi:MAG: sugar kinase [Nitrososphaerota archaeon]|nr:sugar kinase [Candidatus Bathyarchaeota archaeon]MDW8049138.1 sugar kinase [Nitrososphaerota archaeon]
MDKKVVTFGEIMLRLSPPGFQRFIQARSFDATYGGGEANVAISLANFKIPVEFVTRLPPNDLGDACLNYIRQFGVKVDNVIRGGDRLGIYFLETGAVQRGSKVIYDRANSSFATITPGMISWEKVFTDACWFHWTGITPAVSKGAAEACLDAVQKAKAAGLTVSADLNYRAQLWKWGKTASEVMAELLRYADIAICNEEDAEKVFGIKAPGVDVISGKVEADKYLPVAQRLMEIFPNLKKVAITLRGSISASHNTWSGVLYDGKTFYKAPVYQITHIVDRVGGGDAFAAGLIYGLLKFGEDLQRVLNFAVAASCLKHTIVGDSNMIGVDEVERLAAGIASGRIAR